jgi:hypothetical protein
MRAFHARHPTRTILIDWGGSGIPQRYGGDGLHIGYAGEARLARFIHARVHPYMPPRHPIALTTNPAHSKDCGTIRVNGRRRAVFIERGPRRIGCAAARRLAGAKEPAALRHYNWFDWRFLGRPPWTDVFARRDGRIIVAARTPVPEPRPDTDPPAPSAG